MATLNIDADSYGFHEVRNIGYQLKLLSGNFDFDDSYPTGGEDFDLSNYFPKGVRQINFTPINGKIFEYDKYQKKIIAREISDGTEVSNGTDVSGIANQEEVQELTVIAGGGTYDIGVEATNEYSAAYNVTAATLKTNLGGLDDVLTPASITRTGSGTSESPYVYTITHDIDQVASGVDVMDVSSLTDVPQVTDLTIDATGGTFTLTVGGEDVSHSASTDLAYDIAAADLATAINAITGFSGVAVSESEGVYTITFTAGDGDVAVVADGASLTGGDGTATVEETTAYAEASASIEITQASDESGVSFIAMGY